MYTKVVQSGTQIEIYEYERDPPQKAPRKKKRNAYRKRSSRNVFRARSTFFRLVRSNIGTNKRPALLTLTMREVCTLREAWRAFTLFAQRVRAKRKGVFSFVAVPEFQKRGAVHFHVLAWGLSDDEIISERHTRRIALLWGHGFVDIRPTDGSPKLAGYLSKYMFKAMWDERLLGNKSFSSSRNLVRSVSISAPSAVDVAKEQWGITGDTVPLTEKTYSTKWMGSCNYKTYSLEV